ncbi:MAG: glycosyltransferase [Prevotella sp.]|jgi:glycosyltransferase involved in cell wall biosynthesis|nr:glycosyltransferase [Prevotella sp.]
MNTKFSVLMSVYIKEHPSFLRQSLDSVFCQTLPPDEVVLIEDGPLTDELHGVIAEYRDKHPELKVYPQEHNAGLGSALNIGLKLCTNDLVARMDTDDICHPDRFEKEVKFMTEHPDIDICGSNLDEFDGDPSCVRSHKVVPEMHDEIVKYARRRNPINHPTAIYRRDKVLAVGGYQGFPEDYCLCIKMIMGGCRFHNLQESLLHFRFTDDAIRRRGGWQHAKEDFKSQLFFYRIGFTNLFEFITNCMIRMSVRIIPNSLRVMFYKKILRKE